MNNENFQLWIGILLVTAFILLLFGRWIPAGLNKFIAWILAFIALVMLLTRFFLAGQ